MPREWGDRVLRIAPTALGLLANACASAPAIPPNPQFNPNVLTPVGKSGTPTPEASQLEKSQLQRLIPTLSIFPLDGTTESDRLAKELKAYQDIRSSDPERAFERDSQLVAAASITATKPNQDPAQDPVQTQFNVLVAKTTDNSHLLYIRYVDGEGNVQIEPSGALRLTKNPDGSQSIKWTIATKGRFVTVMEDFVDPVLNPDGTINWDKTNILKTVVADPATGEKFDIEKRVADNGGNRQQTVGGIEQIAQWLGSSFDIRPTKVEAAADNSKMSPDKVGGIVGIPDLSRDKRSKETADNVMRIYNDVMTPREPVTELSIRMSKDGRVYAVTPTNTPLLIAEKNTAGEYVWRLVGYKDVDTKGMTVGSGVNVWSRHFLRDTTYKQLFLRLFNLGSTDGALGKWELYNTVKAPDNGKLSPTEIIAQYDWTDFDLISKFLKENGIPLRLMHLVDFGPKSNVPTWLDKLSNDELKTFIELHVQSIIQRAQQNGVGVAEISVVNEAFWHNERAAGLGPNNFFGVRLGDEYIRIAFRAAQKAAPNAKLILNDNLSYEKDTNIVINSEHQALFDFVKRERENGLPIHAVGIESHLLARDFIKGGNDKIDQNVARFKEEMKQMMKMYKDINVPVIITELDVNIGGLPNPMPIEEKEALKAKIYRAVFEAALESENCASVTTWGFDNRSTWVMTKDYPYPPGWSPLPYDNNQPTRSFFEIMQTLFEKVEKK